MIDTLAIVETIRRGLSGFEIPAGARMLHPGIEPETIEGVSFVRYIYHDEESGFGRVFWMSVDGRIVLLAPLLRCAPFAMQIDGEPLPKPFGMIEIDDCASYAVKHMRKLDAMHEDLEDSPDGE